MSIKMSEVTSLVFSGEDGAQSDTNEEGPKTSVSTLADPTLPAARKAYASLRKLADAARIRLPYSQYGTLVIEARPVVEEALAVLPYGSLRSDLARAMEAYTDAGLAWGAVQANDILPIATEPGATLMEKYRIKPGVNAVAQADHLRLDTTLKTIWAVAGAALNNAAYLLEQ